MGKKNKIILLIIFIVTIFALCVIYIFDYQNEKKLSSKTEAIITSVKSSKSRIKYCSEYEFVINNNKYYGTYCSFRKHNTGELLVIRYDPNKPEYNFEESSYDNYSIYSPLTLFSLFIFIGELVYIQEKLINSKSKIKFEERVSASKKIFKLIFSISFVLLLLTVLISCYSINHYVVGSIKTSIYSLFVTMLFTLIVYSFIIKQIYKVINNPKLLKEIKESKAINCEISSIYFTSDSLIEMGFRLKIIYYSDIALMKKITFSDQTSSIYIVTKNLKKYKIATVNCKNNLCHKRIMTELRKKVPNILENDTKENMEIIKKIKSQGN